MSHRKKILLIERDDFLREILGNLLHKKNHYMLNGFCVQDGINAAQGLPIETLVIGTSCDEFKGKQTLTYIRKHIECKHIFVLNNTEDTLDYVHKKDQMKISELSIQKLLTLLP